MGEKRVCTYFKEESPLLRQDGNAVRNVCILMEKSAYCRKTFAVRFKSAERSEKI